MKKEVSQNIADTFSSPPVQKLIATATISSGWLVALKIIPFVLGIIATVIGIMASWTIYKKNKLEIENMIEDRKEQKKRRKVGLPLRRKHDDEVDNE